MRILTYGRSLASRLNDRATLALPTVAGAVALVGLGSATHALTNYAPARTTPAVALAPAAATPEPAHAPVVSSPRAPTPVTWEMSNVDDARVDRWVKRFSGSLKGDFQSSLDRMARFEGMISSKLDDRQMPEELIYLAMIESQFRPTAKSHASALGLWQFMGATARRYGLAVRRGVDERTDPVKSTDAALAYLSALHDRFGSWYLAAAAYNSGEGTVARALRRAGTKASGSDSDFFRIANHLPRETREYVPKLVAAARIGKEREKYGFTPAPQAEGE
jgi:peptidoglycan lytic transglycosylase D